MGCDEAEEAGEEGEGIGDVYIRGSVSLHREYR